MAQAALRHIVLGLAMTGLLMGCVDGAGSGTGGTSATASPGGTATRSGTGRDIEAPEVYQTTDSALWDGRPSLGGIWVAAADAQNPERVIMFNPATGKSVQGALFRRERENPGPRLQISSDAAEALGILAGQPSEIRVTALRRSEPEARVAPADDAGAAEATASSPEADSDAVATAAAATAALAATGAATEAGAGVEAEAEVGAAPVTEAEPPRRKTWKERREEARAEREAKKAADAAAKAAAAGAIMAEGAEIAATPDIASITVIESVPLDAGVTEATATPAPAVIADPAPAAEPRKTRRQIREEEAAAAAAANAAAAAEASPAPAAEPPATGGRPIQIASFSKEENANRAVQALAKTGVTAQARRSETGGKVVWSVVAMGDAAMLATIKSAGFADAYFLQ